MRRWHKNAEPSLQDLLQIGRDMVKEGKFAEAREVLVGEARLPEGGVATQFYAAVVEVRGEGRTKEARALFKEVRKIYREHKIPYSLSTFVSWNVTNIRKDMAIALTETPSDLTIRKLDDDRYEVRVHRAEYEIVYNDDVAKAVAIDRVRDDLKSEPEMFNQDFLERFIDQDELQSTIRNMVMEDDYWDEIAKYERDRFWEEAERAGLDVPDEDENGERDDPPQDLIDQMKERTADDRARDPMAYLRDIGLEGEELWTWLMEQVGIDVEAAAQAAVNEDGIGHFMSSYDGETYETVSNFVYYRVN